jgi:hypothetical protein
MLEVKISFTTQINMLHANVWDYYGIQDVWHSRCVGLNYLGMDKYRNELYRYLSDGLLLSVRLIMYHGTGLFHPGMW